MSNPFIIAEMSGNHNHSLSNALAIVDAAAEAGVDAVKLQTYTAATMTLDIHDGDFLIQDPDSLWNGENLYSLYQKAYTPWEWHKPIFDRCRERGILGFSTPFDETSVDFLESLSVPFYKVAAFENGDVPLLKKIARTHKPIIVSLGMLSLTEIEETVNVLRANQCSEITLLKCTSVYPASPDHCNLLTIQDLKSRFPECRIGLSDHTLGIGVSIGAVALGAEIIEKHFTLDRNSGGVDSAFSMNPAEMAQLVKEARRIFRARGQISYKLSESEKKSLIYRRSIYVCQDIARGEVFTKQNIRCIRPGRGLHPREYENIMGKNAKHPLKAGTPLHAEDIE